MNVIGNTNPRYLAAQIIAHWLISGEYPNRILAVLDQDRAAITELVYGVVRWKRLLEWILKQMVRRIPPPRLKAFLLTALYELFMMHNTAEYAVLNETVTAVKKKTSPKQANFVNAVLRQALRGREKITAEISKQKPGIRLSHPDLLVNRWINNYGEAKTLRLCEWNNSRPNIIIRLNTLRPEHRLNALTAELRNHYGINFENGRDGSSPRRSPWRSLGPSRPQSEDRMPRRGIPTLFLRVPHGIRIEDLPGYREGLFLVIDPFAANAVELLAPQPGDAVLDACAAPGGKTFLIAERMRAKGTVLAVDRDEQRLLILKNNLQRLGISDFVDVRKQDILDCHSRLDRESRSCNDFKMDSRLCGNDRFNPACIQYDRILADVPCSNTGVIRRKPDVRWNFSVKNLAKLTAIQSRMLDKLAGLLKPGGRLVYSTCSLEPEENQLLIAAWLKNNSGFSLREERHYFPPESNTDGGYAAAITSPEPSAQT